MNRKHITASFSIVVVVVVLTGVFVWKSDSTIFEKPPVDPFAGLQARHFEEEEKQWQARIAEVGSGEAYGEFKEAYRDFSYGEQHTLAHIFGVLLYNAEGIDGVAVCDNTFAFGCYHSFFGQAITENGLSVIKDLDQACIDVYGLYGLGCPHGIGHGILSSIGHGNLTEALEQCSTLSWKGPIGGCTSGVFMEFHFLTMVDPSSQLQRETPEEDVYFPCEGLPQQFQQACYFEQPAWWRGVFGKDNYEAMGEACVEIETEPEREACLRGTGSVVAQYSGYEIDTIIEQCALMPSQRSDVLCRQGAANLTVGEPDKREEAARLCEGMNDVDMSICLLDFGQLNNI